MTASPDVLIVGAGMAGAACAARCTALGLAVRVLDRGRRPGGRLAVRTLRDVPEPGLAHPVDVGAAGFAVTDPAFGAVVDGWRRRGLVRDWTDALRSAGPDGLGATGTDRMQLAASGGLRALVDDLLEGVEVVPGTTVGALDAAGAVDGVPARAVVLAMPGPQAARLLTRHPDLAVVADQPYEPTLSLLARWDARAWPEFDRVRPEGVPELGLVVDDGRRRGDGAAVLVAHATPGFAAERLADPEQGRAPMVAAMRRLLGIAQEPADTRIQRWTFSQPASGRDRRFLLERGIGLCGDGWSPDGGVEGAWRSGDALGAELARTLRAS